MNNQIQSQRQPVDQLTLMHLVAPEVTAQMNAGATFTAYSITKILREQHVDLEIVHDEVRYFVYQTMEPFVQLNQYAVEPRDWNGVEANTFFPYVAPNVVQSTAQKVVQAVKQLGAGLIDWGK